jgi:hypothetical protein
LPSASQVAAARAQRRGIPGGNVSPVTETLP